LEYGTSADRARAGPRAGHRASEERPLLVADRRAAKRLAHPDRAGWRAVVPEHDTGAGVSRRLSSVPDVWGSARHPLGKHPGAGPDGGAALEDRPHLEVSPERPARPQPGPSDRTRGGRSRRMSHRGWVATTMRDRGAASAPNQHSAAGKTMTTRASPARRRLALGLELAPSGPTLSVRTIRRLPDRREQLGAKQGTSHAREFARS
jgi:hypothetical protein